MMAHMAALSSVDTPNDIHQAFVFDLYQDLILRKYNSGEALDRDVGRRVRGQNLL